MHVSIKPETKVEMRSALWSILEQILAGGPACIFHRPPGVTCWCVTARDGSKCFEKFPRRFGKSLKNVYELPTNASRRFPPSDGGANAQLTPSAWSFFVQATHRPIVCSNHGIDIVRKYSGGAKWVEVVIST